MIESPASADTPPSACERREIRVGTEAVIVGLATGTYLHVGNKIEAEIEGLGKSEVKIIPTRHRPANESNLTLGARTWSPR